ncbi:MAG: hypothetical protein H5T61_00775 [Thermoflexales bacterium]|nr:hypothetical protein [Thermoflexales bacterium]
MSVLTKIQILRALDRLPPDSLHIVAEFVEFLRAKAEASAPSMAPPQRVVKLGGLWEGYSFSEEEIRAARREAWTGLGRGLDG